MGTNIYINLYKKLIYVEDALIYIRRGVNNTLKFMKNLKFFNSY